MENFLKITAGVLITVILSITLSKQGKEISVLLITAASCMVAAAAISYLQPVTEFIDKINEIGNLDRNISQILFKAVGIGLLAEISCSICTDSGNGSLAKVLQILACAVILWLSIPLLTELLELVDEILGAL